MNEIQQWIGTTYQTANELVARLVEAGVLSEITGQARNRRFMYHSYISLFSDETPETRP